MTAAKVKQALKKLADRERAISSARFFKTGKGYYGEGDKFLGIIVPAQRSVAKRFIALPLLEIKELLASPYHEHRLTALLILVAKFKRATEAEKKKIVKFYLANTKRINNWDLVDLSAPNILGEWLVAQPDDKLLERLAESEYLWERRIAVLAGLSFIKRNQLSLTFNLAAKLMGDKHDLMHKAIGWMLREAGKRDEKALKNFLDIYKNKMPRTMLRYSIERLSDKDKKKYLMK